MKKKSCVISNDLGFGHGNSSGCYTVLQNFKGKSFVLSKISKGKQNHIFQPLSGLSIVSLGVDIFLIYGRIYTETN